MSEAKQRHVCPKCQRGDRLWQGVTIQGWVDIDTYLEREGAPETDFAWYDNENQYGCGECGWEGIKQGLTVHGLDDKPLPVIHPNQLRFGEAA